MTVPVRRPATQNRFATDTDAVLSLTVAGQRFEAIAGLGAEVLKGLGSFQPVEL